MAGNVPHVPEDMGDNGRILGRQQGVEELDRVLLLLHEGHPPRLFPLGLGSASLSIPVPGAKFNRKLDIGLKNVEFLFKSVKC